MTIFGKVLIGLMLATAAVLLIKGDGTTDDVIVTESPAEETVETTPTDDTVFNGSMKDLIARGGDYECTFSQTNDMSDSTGTVFISGAKLRGDFKTTVKAVSNMNVESHMISDGAFMYTWSSMMPTGMKIAIAEGSTAETSPATQSFDYNQKLDYDCKPWTSDVAKFTLPTDITFTEIKS